MTNSKSFAINQSINLCKFIASLFVVLIHVRLPGDWGEYASCLARFAVPLFFAISGYFSLNLTSEKAAKRIRHILKLSVVSTLIYVLWGIWKSVFVTSTPVSDYLRQTINEKSLTKWLILGINPFSGHLWYLAAILTCYVILWAYIKFHGKEQVNYKPLYTVAIICLLFQIILGVNADIKDFGVPYEIYRNALFSGLPMFAMGMFMRENAQRIIENFNLNAVKLVGIIIFGVFLSVLQWKSFGKCEMPVGAVVEVIGLMLLVISHPKLPLISGNKNSFVNMLGNISLIVYIIHMLFNHIINAYSAEVAFFALVKANEFVYPFAVILFSVIAGIIYDLSLNAVKALKSKRKN